MCLINSKLCLIKCISVIKRTTHEHDKRGVHTTLTTQWQQEINSVAGATRGATVASCDAGQRGMRDATVKDCAITCRFGRGGELLAAFQASA